MIEINEASIKKAIQENELCAYYQPQVDTITHDLKSAEALCRWIAKDGTLIKPDSFIPLAEKSQLICDIDWYILNETCQLLQKLTTLGHAIPIGVNFSRNHLKEHNFLDKLCSIVDSYHIEHHMIIVEVTETSLLEKNMSVVKGVSKVKEKGFKIAVDDFDSGLSSLSFIKDVEADILKIDQSILCEESTEEKSRLILTSMIDLFNNLHFVTVAEGVENQSQLGVLKTSGCQLIQGYLFSKPLPEDEFIQYVLQHESNHGDVLKMQGPLGASNLMMQAIFKKHPMIIMSNLTQDSYVMMAYENFHTHYSPASGIFSELIERDTNTMHPEDQELFRHTFSIPHLMEEYKKGSESVSCITRQRGDDGIYRRVESTDYFVKSPSTNDVLIITLCEDLD